MSGKRAKPKGPAETSAEATTAARRGSHASGRPPTSSTVPSWRPRRPLSCLETPVAGRATPPGAERRRKEHRQPPHRRRDHRRPAARPRGLVPHEPHRGAGRGHAARRRPHPVDRASSRCAGAPRHAASPCSRDPARVRARSCCCPASSWSRWPVSEP